MLIAVEGLRCDAHAGASENKPWHSTAIVERVSSREMKTSSGSLYVLDGPMLEKPPTTAGMPPEVMASFVDGFPEDWHELLASKSPKAKSPRDNAPAAAPTAAAAAMPDPSRVTSDSERGARDGANSMVRPSSGGVKGQLR